MQERSDDIHRFAYFDVLKRPDVPDSSVNQPWWLRREMKIRNTAAKICRYRCFLPPMLTCKSVYFRFVDPPLLSHCIWSNTKFWAPAPSETQAFCWRCGRKLELNIGNVGSRFKPRPSHTSSFFMDAKGFSSPARFLNLLAFWQLREEPLPS
jgi:hypothetical protein